MDNPDNPELLEELADVVDVLSSIEDELSLIRRSAFPPKPRIVETGEPGYPWAPGTQTQGFLNARWNRRDGNVYATPAPLTGGHDNSQEAQPSRAGRRQRSGARSDH
jgi:hypothetical protein